MRDNYTKGKKYFKKAMRGGDSQADDVQEEEVSKNEPVLGQYLEVVVYNNGNFEKALRAFRATVQKERILSLYKEKQSYEKPSDKKRRKRNEMKRKKLELNDDKHDFFSLKETKKVFLKEVKSE
jgi:ribosomal protein S21